MPFPLASTLQIGLRNAGVRNDASLLFEFWPSLRAMALRFCWYVTPFVASSDGWLIEVALRDAVRGFAASEKTDSAAAYSAYIKGLLGAVKPLCALRLSVQMPDDSWPIWDYDEPLGGWMKARGAMVLQSRERDEELDSVAPTIKFLAYVCAARDMRLAGLQWHHVIEREKLVVPALQ